MNSDRLHQVIAAAIAEGILPPHATRPVDNQRPWPVILLTGLGAWLSAVPLLIVLSICFEGVKDSGPGPYIIGAVLIAATVAMLRAQLPLFVEQLGLPALLVGGVTLGLGLFRDMSSAAAALLMAFITCGVACLIQRGWLRALLSAAACGLTIFGLTLEGADRMHADSWYGLHAAVALWLPAQWRLDNTLDDPRGMQRTAALEWMSFGWILATLAGLAYCSGMTFLLGATMGEPGGGSSASWMDPVHQEGSLAMATAAAYWTGRRWPSLRKAWSLLVALVLVGMAWLIPTLGAVLLVLAVFATARRWRLAIAAGVAAAWIIGAFYYQVSMPLAHKAAIMAGAGALLGAISWLALRGKLAFGATNAAGKVAPAARVSIAVCALVSTAATIRVSPVKTAPRPRIASPPASPHFCT